METLKSQKQAAFWESLLHKYEKRRDELEKQQCALQQRLEALEHTMPTGFMQNSSSPAPKQQINMAQFMSQIGKLCDGPCAITPTAINKPFIGDSADKTFFGGRPSVETCLCDSCSQGVDAILSDPFSHNPQPNTVGGFKSEPRPNLLQSQSLNSKPYSCLPNSDEQRPRETHSFNSSISCACSPQPGANFKSTPNNRKPNESHRERSELSSSLPKSDTQWPKPMVLPSSSTLCACSQQSYARPRPVLNTQEISASYRFKSDPSCCLPYSDKQQSKPDASSKSVVSCDCFQQSGITTENKQPNVIESIKSETCSCLQCLASTEPKIEALPNLSSICDCSSFANNFQPSIDDSICSCNPCLNEPPKVDDCILNNEDISSIASDSVHGICNCNFWPFSRKTKKVSTNNSVACSCDPYLDSLQFPTRSSTCTCNPCQNDMQSSIESEVCSCSSCQNRIEVGIVNGSRSIECACTFCTVGSKLIIGNDSPQLSSCSCNPCEETKTPSIAKSSSACYCGSNRTPMNSVIPNISDVCSCPACTGMSPPLQGDTNSLDKKSNNPCSICPCTSVEETCVEISSPIRSDTNSLDNKSNNTSSICPCTSIDESPVSSNTCSCTPSFEQEQFSCSMAPKVTNATNKKLVITSNPCLCAPSVDDEQMCSTVLPKAMNTFDQEFTSRTCLCSSSIEEKQKGYSIPPKTMNAFNEEMIITSSACLCKPYPGREQIIPPNTMARVSSFSLHSADYVFMSKLNELANQEKVMKRQIQNMEHREKTLTNTLRQANESIEEKYRQRLSEAQQSGDNACLRFETASKRLMDENDKLIDELQDARLELKQCMEQLTGPISRQIDRDRRRSHQLEEQLDCASKAIAGKDTQYIKDMNSMQNQLQYTCRDVIELTSTNGQLNEEICMLRCKYQRLEQELINQKISEAYTLQRLNEAMCSCPCQIKQKIKPKEDKLRQIARNLGETLQDINKCSPCSKLPTNLKDTIKGIKDIADMVGKQNDKQKKRKEEKRKKVCTCTSIYEEDESSGSAESDHEPSHDVATTVQKQEKPVSTETDAKGSFETRKTTKRTCPSFCDRGVSNVALTQESKKSSVRTSKEEIDKTSSKEPDREPSEVPSKDASTQPSKEVNKKCSCALSEQSSKSLSIHESESQDLGDGAIIRSSSELSKNSKASSQRSGTLSSRTSSKSGRCSKVSIQEPSTRTTSMQSTTHTQSTTSSSEVSSLPLCIPCALEEEIIPVEILTEIEVAGDTEVEIDTEVEVDTEVNIYESISDGINITTTITGSGTLEVITEGPAGTIETVMSITPSGNIEVTTEVTEYPPIGDAGSVTSGPSSLLVKSSTSVSRTMVESTVTEVVADSSSYLTRESSATVKSKSTTQSEIGSGDTDALLPAVEPVVTGESPTVSQEAETQATKEISEQVTETETVEEVETADDFIDNEDTKGGEVTDEKPIDTEEHMREVEPTDTITEDEFTGKGEIAIEEHPDIHDQTIVKESDSESKSLEAQTTGKEIEGEAVVEEQIPIESISTAKVKSDEGEETVAEVGKGIPEDKCDEKCGTVIKCKTCHKDEKTAVALPEEDPHLQIVTTDDHTPTDIPEDKCNEKCGTVIICKTCHEGEETAVVLPEDPDLKIGTTDDHTPTDIAPCLEIGTTDNDTPTDIEETAIVLPEEDSHLKISTTDDHTPTDIAPLLEIGTTDNDTPTDIPADKCDEKCGTVIICKTCHEDKETALVLPEEGPQLKIGTINNDTPTEADKLFKESDSVALEEKQVDSEQKEILSQKEEVTCEPEPVSCEQEVAKPIQEEVEPEQEEVKLEQETAKYEQEEFQPSMETQLSSKLTTVEDANVESKPLSQTGTVDDSGTAEAFEKANAIDLPVEKIDDAETKLPTSIEIEVEFTEGELKPVIIEAEVEFAKKFNESESINEEPFLKTETDQLDELRKDVTSALCKASENVLGVLDQANINVTDALEKANRDVERVLALAVKESAEVANKQAFTEADEFYAEPPQTTSKAYIEEEKITIDEIKVNESEELKYEEPPIKVDEKNILEPIEKLQVTELNEELEAVKPVLSESAEPRQDLEYTEPREESESEKLQKTEVLEPVKITDLVEDLKITEPANVIKENLSVDIEACAISAPLEEQPSTINDAIRSSEAIEQFDKSSKIPISEICRDICSPTFLKESGAICTDVCAISAKSDKVAPEQIAVPSEEITSVTNIAAPPPSEQLAVPSEEITSVTIIAVPPTPEQLAVPSEEITNVTFIAAPPVPDQLAVPSEEITDATIAIAPLEETKEPIDVTNKLTSDSPEEPQASPADATDSVASSVHDQLSISVEEGEEATTAAGTATLQDESPSKMTVGSRESQKISVAVGDGLKTSSRSSQTRLSQKSSKSVSKDGSRRSSRIIESIIQETQEESGVTKTASKSSTTSCTDLRPKSSSQSSQTKLSSKSGTSESKEEPRKASVSITSTLEEVAEEDAAQDTDKVPLQQESDKSIPSKTQSVKKPCSEFENVVCDCGDCKCDVCYHKILDEGEGKKETILHTREDDCTCMPSCTCKVCSGEVARKSLSVPAIDEQHRKSSTSSSDKKNSKHPEDCDCIDCLCSPCGVTEEVPIRKITSSPTMSHKCNEPFTKAPYLSEPPISKHPRDCDCIDCLCDPNKLDQPMQLNQAVGSSSNRIICIPCRSSAKSIELIKKRHPPDCDCLECLCNPCGTPSDDKIFQHPPHCDCPLCACKPCNDPAKLTTPKVVKDKFPVETCDCEKYLCLKGVPSKKDDSFSATHPAKLTTSKTATHKLSTETCDCEQCLCLREVSSKKNDSFSAKHPPKEHSNQKHPTTCDCVDCILNCGDTCPLSEKVLSPATSLSHPPNCKCPDCAKSCADICPPKPTKPKSTTSKHLPSCDYPKCTTVCAETCPDVNTLKPNKVKTGHASPCDCLDCRQVCGDTCPDPKITKTEHQPDCDCENCSQVCYEQKIVHATSCDCSECSQVCDVAFRDSKDYSEKDTKFENKVEKMEQETTDRKRELDELRDLMKQIQCACNKAEIQASSMKPTDASYQKTLSSLQISLNALESKCKQKDKMIALITNELKLRANSKVFNEMLQKLAQTRSSEIVVDFDRKEICDLLPQPVCDCPSEKPSNQLKDVELGESNHLGREAQSSQTNHEDNKPATCTHKNYPNCPCTSKKKSKTEPEGGDNKLKKKSCKHPNYPNCECVISNQKTKGQSTVAKSSGSKRCGCTQTQTRKSSKQKSITQVENNNGVGEEIKHGTLQKQRHKKGRLPVNETPEERTSFSQINKRNKYGCPSGRKSSKQLSEKQISPIRLPSPMTNLVRKESSELYCPCNDNFEPIDPSPMTITDIRSITADSLLVKWSAPANKFVTGYEVLVDGDIKSRVHSTGRTSAVLHSLTFRKCTAEITVYATCTSGRLEPPARLVFQL